MQSIPFTPKWSRIARLSLVLATVAGTISTHAQPNNSPQDTPSSTSDRWVRR